MSVIAFILLMLKQIRKGFVIMNGAIQIIKGSPRLSKFLTVFTTWESYAFTSIFRLSI